MTELFEYVLIALACPLLLPLVTESEDPEQLREHNEWLFRMNGAAVPVENGQAMAAVQEKTREEKK